MDWEAWGGLGALILAVAIQVLYVWQAENRAMAKQALFQQQLEMFREAIALMKYGAREEAEEMIEKAIDLGAI